MNGSDTADLGATSEVSDWTVEDTDTARAILNYLGIGNEASREPGIDRRRDKIASMIRKRIDEALVASLPQPAGGQFQQRCQCEFPMIKYGGKSVSCDHCGLPPAHKTATDNRDGAGLAASYYREAELIPVPHANAAEVKTLSWEHTANYIYHSAGGIVSYSILPVDAGGLPYSFRTHELPAHYYVMGPGADGQKFADIDIAMEHGQSLYNALVRSALVGGPNG